MKTKPWLTVPVAVAFLIGCSSGSATAERSFGFPDSAGGLLTRQAQTERFGREDDTVEQRELTVAQLSAAYDGAVAASQAYADDSLRVLVTAYAVNASSPKLWSPQANEKIAERLRLAAPPERVERSGDAECVVESRSFVPDSTGPTRPDERVLRCQGVRDGVTVLIPEIAPSVDADTALRVVADSLDHFRP
ncbi:hypothetical protein [Rhodococcoides kyotonense]|uniref:Lipoprotein n=1 Tax=Rhodococcoides kyotonense TaxID=398843 RepID=A0A239HDG5_9NOCA|nr:hypothetical protein [Rhodococcus kyotonensis]SNS78843.1 hypothetical protein SAMN05421642_105189 [Rhodococcus kyotonensis]